MSEEEPHVKLFYDEKRFLVRSLGGPAWLPYELYRDIRLPALSCMRCGKASLWGYCCPAAGAFYCILCVWIVQPIHGKVVQE